MRFIKKLFAFILILNVLFSMSLPYASAEITGDAVGNAVRDKLMAAFKSEVGADSTETKNTVQSLNVARQKKTPPQVKVTFTPTNPAPGEQVTATASTTYFMNDPTALYFTWYIQHNNKKPAATNSDGLKTKGGNTDWNKDGEIDIEDYKIEAMRLVANGGFDWQRALGEDAPLCKDTSISSEQRPDYCTLDNQYKNKVGDNDSYAAIIGGDDQKGRPSHCFLHNYSTGDEYEFPECGHLFPNAPGETTAGGDNRFTLKEEEFWHTNPASKDTTGSGTVDEAAIAGLGKMIFSWNYSAGDKVGVVVEGISTESTAYKDSSYKTMWALLKNDCSAASSNAVASKPSNPAPVNVDDAPVYSDYIPTETVEVVTAIIGGVETKEFITLKSKSVLTTTTTITYAEGPYIVTSSGAGPSSIATTTITTRTRKYKQIISDPTAIYDISMADSAKEYSTTPYETSAITTLSTTTGSPASPRKLSSSNQNPAALINSCLENNMLEPSEGNPNQKIEINLSFSPDSPTNSASSSSDTADQLLVQSSIVGVDNKDFLNYAWQVYLSSDLTAADKDWKLLTLTNLAEQRTGLKKLSGIGLDILKMKLSFTENFLRSKSALTPDNKKNFYIKFVLRAAEGQNDKRKEGVGTIIVPIQLSSNKIIIVPIAVTPGAPDAGGEPTFNFKTDSTKSNVDERCKDGLSSAICPVFKNEIVAAKYMIPEELEGDSNGNDLSDTALKTVLDNYDFQWSFDNKPVSETNKKEAYFPIIDERGTQHTISLNVINRLTGEKSSLVRTLKVTDPAITIESKDTNTCAPTLLGYYIDPINKNPSPDPGTESNQWPDISENFFEALPNTTVQLRPTPNTNIIDGSWFFDGTLVTPANMSALGIAEIQDDNTLVFKTGSELGKKHTLTYESLYTQPDLIKQALVATWDVSQTSFYEKKVSKSVEIQITGALSSSRVAMQSKTPQQKIMASLFAAIPSYINFLFRVILTMALILFLTKTVFSLFPKQNQV